MRLLLRCLRFLLMSSVAAIAGGIAAGTAFMTAGLVFDPPGFVGTDDVLGSFLFFVALLFSSWIGGAFFGLVLGLVPTMIVGAALLTLRDRATVKHGATWACTGALAGIATAYLLHGTHGAPINWDWILAWVAGGTAAAYAYWLLEFRLFAPNS